MSIFDRIKGAIWGRADEKSPKATTVASSAPKTASAAGPSGATEPAPQPHVVGAAPVPAGSTPPPAPTAAQSNKAATPAPSPTSASTTSSASVDVEAILDAAAKKNSQKLDWRHSIVDTMKALGMESSLSERKELADELGYTGDKSDSAAMNIWLQKALMKKLSENGGKVPANLMD